MLYCILVFAIINLISTCNHFNHYNIKEIGCMFKTKLQVQFGFDIFKSIANNIGVGFEVAMHINYPPGTYWIYST